MMICYITFRSITGAQMGERLLNQFGITHVLMRTPAPMTKKGCGYALRLKSRDLDFAVEQFRLNQVPYQRLFGDLGDGIVEDLGV